MSGAVFVLAIALSSLTVWREPIAQGQESKRYVYKVVDIPTDNNAMQTTLNEYGVAYGVQKSLSMIDRVSVRGQLVVLGEQRAVTAPFAFRSLSPLLLWSTFCVLFTILLPPQITARGALCITTIKHPTRTCSTALRLVLPARKSATAAPTT